METKNINIDTESNRSDNRSDKLSKAKKAAVKAGKFAAAAGLGAAGTVAANAFNVPDEETNIEGTPIDDMTEGDTVEIVNTPQDFNPNDIVIEEAEDVVEENEVDVNILEDKDEVDNGSVVEPQPITTENNGLIPSEEGLQVVTVDDGDNGATPSEEGLLVVNVDDTVIDDNNPTDWTEPSGYDEIFIEPVYDTTSQFLNDDVCVSENPQEEFGVDDILGDILNA